MACFNYCLLLLPVPICKAIGAGIRIFWTVSQAFPKVIPGTGTPSGGSYPNDVCINWNSKWFSSNRLISFFFFPLCCSKHLLFSLSHHSLCQRKRATLLTLQLLPQLFTEYITPKDTSEKKKQSFGSFPPFLSETWVIFGELSQKVVIQF